MRNMLLSLDIFRNRQHPVEPLIPPLDVMVTLGGRRLGDIDGVGGRKGLFQPLRQGFVEPLIPPLDVMVTLGGRRLGDIDGVGGRKGLFQPLRQGFVQPALFRAIL